MFRKICIHEWKVTEVSNILQLDEMGYPLRLVICKCKKCGKSDQQWRDVSRECLKELDNGESVLCKWKSI